MHRKLRIGDVFTPREWAMKAADIAGIHDAWLDGATVFDPCMGDGALLEAFILKGLQDGRKPKKLPAESLFGNELNRMHFRNAVRVFREKYEFDMVDNFSNHDFLDLEPVRYDIIFGNPPWINFNNLPGEYRERVKPFFHRYDLVGDRRDLLLGGSRIDFAALVIKRAIRDFLKPSGKAVFFMPLSLLQNDGAGTSFRTFRVNDTVFSLDSVHDLSGQDIFRGIATRYCLARFTRDKRTHYPIPYFIREDGGWTRKYAAPRFGETDPLGITNGSERKMEPIPVSRESVPRQGINTCGTNTIFFFSSCKPAGRDLVEVGNKTVSGVILPSQFVYPLITSSNFMEDDPFPKKWVLLPYTHKGKPLEQDALEAYPHLLRYLKQHRERLLNRKGAMIGSWIRRGYWWALLGVGPYNFFPYKIVWEAYGRNTFRPKVFSGRWQANQSLQAFIPLRSPEDTNRILDELKNPDIEEYLLSMQTGGTMNWAQPGRIKRLLSIQNTR